MDEIDELIVLYISQLRARVNFVRRCISKWDIRPMPSNYRRK